MSISSYITYWTNRSRGCIIGQQFTFNFSLDHH